MNHMVGRRIVSGEGWVGPTGTGRAVWSVPAAWGNFSTDVGSLYSRPNNGVRRSRPLVLLLIPLLAVLFAPELLPMRPSSAAQRFFFEGRTESHGQLTKPILSDGSFSLMTYNVHGLPWPVVSGRADAMEKIGARLAALRLLGKAPQVVVLQEAFIGEARMIGFRGGYQYSAIGPSSDDRRPADDRNASEPRSLLKGEWSRPWVSSGLMILSDFALSDVRMLPFAAGACSGYDCLANKGMLSARLSVPGLKYPVEIVTTHLNSNRASGQSEAVTRRAYKEQLDALGKWIDRIGSPKGISIVAGDFNVGHSWPRLSIFLQHLRRWNVQEVTAMGRPQYAALCRSREQDCTGRNVIPANVPLVHTTDWQFYRAPADVRIEPVSRSVLFGPDREGQMLSDHVGYSVRYRIG